MRYNQIVSCVQNLPADVWPDFFNRMNQSEKNIVRDQFRSFLPEVLSAVEAHDGILFLQTINQSIENVDWTKCDYLQITQLLTAHRYAEFFKIVGHAGVIKALPDFESLYVFLEKSEERWRFFLLDAMTPFLSHIKINAVDLRRLADNFYDTLFVALKLFRKQLAPILLQFLIQEDLNPQWVYQIIKESFAVLLSKTNIAKDCPCFESNREIFLMFHDIEVIASSEVLSPREANIHKFIKLYEFVQLSTENSSVKSELIRFFGPEFFSKMFRYLQPIISAMPPLPAQRQPPWGRRSSALFSEVMRREQSYARSTGLRRTIMSPNM